MRTIHGAIAVVIAVAAVLVTGANAPTAKIAAPPNHGPIIIKERHGKNLVDSTNWSGYAVTATNGAVTDAKGSWIVPAVSCTATNAYAAFWVGIDGYNSKTVEQIGSDSDCVNGQPQYYVWYEFYPHWSYTVNSLPVKVGDIVSAEVSYSRGSFTVSASVNGGAPFIISTKMNQAVRSSAEWIIEAPWNGGVLPLANFNTISLGYDSTNAANTNYATVGTTSGQISAFAGDVVNINMVSSSGATKSVPSFPLSNDGTSFTDAWVSAGP
jgi:hypothetical protein